MARTHRREPDHFTLLIVPHTKQAAISFRMPHWALYISLLALAGLLVALAVVVIDYGNAQSELAALRQERQVELDRQRAMRQTILAQDEQVRSLTAETQQLTTDVASMDRLVSEVRRVVGLDRIENSAPTRTVTATAQAAAPAPAGAGFGDSVAPLQAGGASVAKTPSSTGGLSAWGSEDRAAGVPSSRGGEVAARDSLASALELETTVDAKLDALRSLRDAVGERVAKVDEASRDDAVSLEKQLRLYDAAPKIAPLDGPLDVTSHFGMRPDPLAPWYSAFHYGVDFAAWYGTDVHATQAGKVVYATWQGNLGWTVEIQHELGYKTIYGHNRDLTVRYGQEVQAGQVIAHVGDTGKATGPHVHYEIELDGKALDPLKYLAVKGGKGVQPQR